MDITLLPDPLGGLNESGLPILILAFYANGSAFALFVEEDGKMGTAPVSTLKADIRYSWTDHKWMDVSPLGAELDEG